VPAVHRGAAASGAAARHAASLPKQQVPPAWVPELQVLAHGLPERAVQPGQAARLEPVQGLQAQEPPGQEQQAVGPPLRLPASRQAARICASSFQRRQPSCGRG